MARWVEVHRLAVAGGQAGIARATGGRIGWVWLARSRFADVARLAESTLLLGEDAGSFYHLGWARSSMGQLVEALAAYEKALRSYRTADDRGSEAGTLSNIGQVYAGWGQRDRALEFYQQALPISREVGNRAGEAATLSNIGAVYDGWGQRDRALEFYQLALPISREVGDRAGEAVTRYNIAMVLRGRGELGGALAELEQVVELDRQVGHPDLASDTAMLERIRQEQAASKPKTAHPDI